MIAQLSQELHSFQKLWQNGYFEGDPLHPIARSSYGDLGFMSTLHATFLCCIKPYVQRDTVALEIGPGRGAWTRALLPAKEVYALDALSAEHNGFYDYVGQHEHVKYFQVSNFECRMLPENHFTYMFSFGCLCHVSFEGIEAYARNLYSKLRSGCHCFWLVSDYEKYNKAVSSFSELSVRSALFRRTRKNVFKEWFINRRRPRNIAPDRDNRPQPGRWYHAGTDRTCEMLESIGYSILDPDVGTCHRDPILHFVKP